MSAIDFLKTTTPKEELGVALKVLREFKACESSDEFLHRPLMTWLVFEMLEEYLAHLVNGDPLKADTLAQLQGAAQ